MGFQLILGEGFGHNSQLMMAQTLFSAKAITVARLLRSMVFGVW